MPKEQNPLLQKTIKAILKVDYLYRTSPSVQSLVNNAPNILQCFKDLKIIQMEHNERIQSLVITSQNNLQKYRESAPKILEEMRQTLNDIRMLQRSVREHAYLANSSEEAYTIIRYTNQQIDQNIRIFNSLINAILSL